MHEKRVTLGVDAVNTKEHVNLKAGDVVYVKRLRRSPSEAEKLIEFPHDHGYAILLGAVPRGFPAVPGIVVLQQMAAIGFISFDDIQEFLGKDALQEVVGKFTAKYAMKQMSEEPEKPNGGLILPPHSEKKE